MNKIDAIDPYIEEIINGREYYRDVIISHIESILCVRNKLVTKKNEIQEYFAKALEVGIYPIINPDRIVFDRKYNLYFYAIDYNDTVSLRVEHYIRMDDHNKTYINNGYLNYDNSEIFHYSCQTMSVRYDMNGDSFNLYRFKAIAGDYMSINLNTIILNIQEIKNFFEVEIHNPHVFESLVEPLKKQEIVCEFLNLIHQN
jgi:hypothetical protein